MLAASRLIHGVAAMPSNVPAAVRSSGSRSKPAGTGLRRFAPSARRVLNSFSRRWHAPEEDSRRSRIRCPAATGRTPIRMRSGPPAAPAVHRATFDSGSSVALMPWLISASATAMRPASAASSGGPAPWSRRPEPRDAQHVAVLAVAQHPGSHAVEHRLLHVRHPEVEGTAGIEPWNAAARRRRRSAHAGSREWFCRRSPGSAA